MRECRRLPIEPRGLETRGTARPREETVLGCDCMTTTELCESAGLTPRELQNWIDNGLLDADEMAGRACGGLRWEFTAEHAACARVLKALHNKGMKLSQLARVANLAFDGQAFVVFDGRELLACRDA